MTPDAFTLILAFIAACLVACCAALQQQNNALHHRIAVWRERRRHIAEVLDAYRNDIERGGAPRPLRHFTARIEVPPFRHAGSFEAYQDIVRYRVDQMATEFVAEMIRSGLVEARCIEHRNPDGYMDCIELHVVAAMRTPPRSLDVHRSGGSALGYVDTRPHARTMRTTFA
jgi:hypothetical protein